MSTALITNSHSPVSACTRSRVRPGKDSLGMDYLSAPNSCSDSGRGYCLSAAFIFQALQLGESLFHWQRSPCRCLGYSSYIQSLPHSLHRITVTGQVAGSNPAPTKTTGLTCAGQGFTRHIPALPHTLFHCS